MRKTTTATTAGIALAFVLCAGTAHADPPTPTDRRNAQLICQEIAANPTPQGLRLSMNDTYAQLRKQGASDVEARDSTASGTAYALLYTCPQYDFLLPR